MELLKYLFDGGPIMFVLVILNVIGWGVVLDRFFAFKAYSRIDNRSLRSRILDYLWNDQVEDAALLCSKTPGPVSAVLLAGLQAFAKHRDRTTDSTPITVTVKEAMDDYSLHAVSAVEKRLAVLATIGNAAPLIGMFGTVAGMITSFDALAESGKADVVAQGIAVALITTAGGLIVALMAVIPFNYFTAKSDAVDLEIEEVKAQFVDTIAQVQEA